ncbi:uncharacterized protein [Rhodnius prolixus]|uniref:uncharacterized protein n=1 Tax=Rhodnius prolixus TaxID=13249 RepID=UPI003D18C905
MASASLLAVLSWMFLVSNLGCAARFSRRHQIVSNDLSAFISQAHRAMEQRFYHLEPSLHKNGVRQEPGSPAWFMGASHSSKPTTKNITHSALMAEEATKYMAHALGVSGNSLTGITVSGTLLSAKCPAHDETWCEAKKYRSFSGHCNNVQTPWWGSTGTAYARYLPSDYADSISLPRGTAIYPEGLPSPRAVSLAVHNQLDRLHTHLVATIAVWAQFVSNDISHTPQMTGYNGERLKCCGVDFQDFHPECFPIRLPEEDPIHGSARCMEYTRSATAPRRSCTLGPREQINEATAYLDASTLYGTSISENEALRSYQSGFLNLPNGLLPPDNTTDCRQNSVHRCFKSGDSRVNEHIGLAALQTLWAREHNRLAETLQLLNPHWPDEVLFQEARKIVIAQIQYITYTEFLPLILGQNTMDAKKLRLKSDGYFTEYDINKDPSVANSVAAAALHFSVSLMPANMKLYNAEGIEIGEDSLGNSFYAPFQLYSKDGMDIVIQSLLKAPALNNYQHINSVFTNHMYEQPNQEGGGLDLIAHLIQRGRDHGIPGYIYWRKFCGKSEVNKFADLRNDISEDTLVSLQTVYKNVTEIDLLSGALSELVPDGATVGPTLACLLSKQFHSIKIGDRHWFENDLSDSSFTRIQLRAIREGTSLARIFCDNTGVGIVQPNAFLAQDTFLNAPMGCSGGAIKPLDLSPWKEEKKMFLFPNKLILESLKNAQNDVSDLHKREWLLYTQNLMADPLSPIGTAFGFNRPKRQASIIANTSIMLEFASSRLVRSFLQGELEDLESSTDVNSLVSVLPRVDLTLVVDPEITSTTGQDILECLETAEPCDHTAKYRTNSGWCNNLERPEFGQSFRPFVRLLPPVYEDAVGAPRIHSVTGGHLPSPRIISTKIHSDTSRPHTRYSLMIMQFAQITDHDLTFTPVNKGFIGEGILNCKDCDSTQTVHPQCFPISIPDNDPYFPSKDSKGKRLCIPATRSMPGQNTLGPREQMNQLTAYLDLSFMYGSDKCEASILRSHSGGRMNTTKNPLGYGKPLLPQTTENPECRAKSGICFNAGDFRASEQPALGSLHTLWLREHNRIAATLSRLNPHWSDETIYQEARRLLSAVYQHITFNEFLPRILGWDAIRKYDLTLLSEGYFKGYDPTCDVTVFNEFSAAAFRFGHSLLRPNFRRASPDFSIREPPVRLRDHFFNPEILYKPGLINEILLGLIDTPMETLDNFITKEVTEHLFENKSIPFSGMDLVSLNIQRARDHGIPAYIAYRRLCGLESPRNFKDLQDTTPSDITEAMAQVYQNIADIDLFPGGMSERSLRGGLVGPTFGCIIGQQFKKIRKCDRFWYENGGEFTRFTPLQLAEIRKASLAGLMCNNLDSVNTIQRHVLDLPDPFMNPRVSCSSITQIDLNQWRERASCNVGSVNIDRGTTVNTSPCVTCTCTKEGPLCQSVKVKNCISLLQNFSPDAVANDTVCKVQCLYVFKVVQEYTQLQSAAVSSLEDFS